MVLLCCTSSPEPSRAYWVMKCRIQGAPLLPSPRSLDPPVKFGFFPTLTLPLGGEGGPRVFCWFSRRRHKQTEKHSHRPWGCPSLLDTFHSGPLGSAAPPIDSNSVKSHIHWKFVVLSGDCIHPEGDAPVRIRAAGSPGSGVMRLLVYEEPLLLLSSQTSMPCLSQPVSHSECSLQNARETTAEP